MARYKELEKDQGMFLEVNLKEQLIPGTFEWALNYLIGKIDLSIFDATYKNDAVGAAAYPPGILLKGIFYNYSLGIISSRPIENAYKSNIITKALACGREPDHATIAAFISSNDKAINAVFSHVLFNALNLALLKAVCLR
jgi:transposase